MAVTVPPAPHLPEEALREVYAYPDPARAPDEQNPYSDAGRLAIKGESMAKLVLMDILRERVPTRELTELRVNQYLRDFAHNTTLAYRWLRWVEFPRTVDRHSPAVSLSSDPPAPFLLVVEIRRVFYTYVGAVCTAHSYSVVKQWFGLLMESVL
ncbi:hypothetical protein C8Q79DRAFT_1012700 [Trametes meyenii]|nr:hypothetical protein C8Q79DRAFT_1012700 [Trametes meyenii]